MPLSTSPSYSSSSLRDTFYQYHYLDEIVMLDLHGTSSSSSSSIQRMSYRIHHIIPRYIAESSLHYDLATKKWLVVGMSMVDGLIQVCETPSLTYDKTWYCYYAATYEEEYRQPVLFSYAGKAHPILQSILSSSLEKATLANCGPLASPPSSGEDFQPLEDTKILMSYVTNSLLGPDLLYEPEYRNIYTPKFLYLRSKPSI
jgi:hypothetical protein